MDVFTESLLIAAANLAQTRNAKAAWGRALVRTDINDSELDFLARSFRGCVEREKSQAANYRNATTVVRILSRWK